MIRNMYPVRLETERLLLRELAESDLADICHYAQDPEVFRYADWGPFNEIETRGFLQMMMSYQKEDPRVHYELAITLKTDLSVIGNCGVQISSLSNCEGWIDCFLSRRYWNQGYAPEADLALFELGFRTLKLHRIFALCASDNYGAEGSLVKVGMQLEGRLREHKLVHGHWQDFLMYSILENEWKSKSAA